MVFSTLSGGMAEWFKAAVLKTVVRKYRGFESYSLRQTSTAVFRRDDRVGRWCSPAKRVWGLYSTEGSNPSLSATIPNPLFVLDERVFLFALKLLHRRYSALFYGALESPQQGALYPPCHPPGMFDLYPAVFALQCFKYHSVVSFCNNSILGTRSAADIDPFF